MADRHDEKAREIARRYETNPASDRIILSRQITAALAEAEREGMRRAAQWRPIETAPKDEEVLIAYWRWRNSMSPGSVVVQSARQTEFHGDGVWSWVVSDNKHGPCPIRGWSEGDIIGWMPLPTPPVNQSTGADRG
jgi:hypothetical protein